MDLPLNTLDWTEILEEADEELYVADLGCGTAEYHSQLKTVLDTLTEEENYDGDIIIFGIEADPEKVAEARVNNPEDDFRYINQRLEEDSNSYTPVDGEFDVVISQHLMCEADNSDQISREADKIRKNTGYNQVHTTC